MPFDLCARSLVGPRSRKLEMKSFSDLIESKTLSISKLIPITGAKLTALARSLVGPRSRKLHGDENFLKSPPIKDAVYLVTQTIPAAEDGLNDMNDEML